MPEFSMMGMADALLALTQWPLDVPLWFLRDLFVCCVFAPLLYVGLKRIPIATMLALVAFMVLGEDLLIMPPPQLLLFFGLGMGLCVAGTGGRQLERIALVLTVGLAVVVAVFLSVRIDRILLSEMDPTLRLALDALLRITMAGGFWLLTG